MSWHISQDKKLILRLHHLCRGLQHREGDQESERGPEPAKQNRVIVICDGNIPLGTQPRFYGYVASVRMPNRMSVGLHSASSLFSLNHSMIAVRASSLLRPRNALASSELSSHP